MAWVAVRGWNGSPNKGLPLVEDGVGELSVPSRQVLLEQSNFDEYAGLEVFRPD